MNKKNLIFVLLAASAVALLFGTDKGKKIRKKIKKKGMDSVESLKSSVDNLKSRMNKYAEENI